MKRYLFFASQNYAYSILRPLEEEIWRRGDEVAWFLEGGSTFGLAPEERQLKTFSEVFDYNPLAVFVPGNYVYDFFPGLKVSVFHGYPIRKRRREVDDYFDLRGWFDIYCTQGESSTPLFSELSEKHRYFKVYETGWCSVDAFFSPTLPPIQRRERPVILYAPTFTRGISSAWDLADTIGRLAAEKPWDWIISFHPKLDDPSLIAQYEAMAERSPNVSFQRFKKGIEDLRLADVMLADSSSVIMEFMMQEKPVVTFRNTHPGPFLLDVQKTEEVEGAIEEALGRPASLIEEIRRYITCHEAHRDGHNSARVLDAVDDFIAHYQGHLPRKPLNLFRKLQLRWRLRYFHL